MPGAPITVTLDLDGGSYHTGTPIQTQAGVTLVIVNGTLVGGSPALIVNGAIFLAVNRNSENRLATVFDDGDRDLLTGDDGRDWFLFNIDGDGDRKEQDRVTDVSDAELATDLDFINGGA